ncbi:hypothetical protein U0129_20965 [Enterobacter hormaechei]|uniref:hypothetical protein n=1 Tax=Enterobacter hormaechei TaxID=158836 RepID=UPI0039C36000
MENTAAIDPDQHELSVLVAKLKSYLQTQKVLFAKLLFEAEALPDQLAAERLREKLLIDAVNDSDPALLMLYTTCRQVIQHHDNMQAETNCCAHAD